MPHGSVQRRISIQGQARLIVVSLMELESGLRFRFRLCGCGCGRLGLSQQVPNRPRCSVSVFSKFP
jgi:hypothetical protein